MIKREQINWQKAIIAGIAGTFAFDLFGFIMMNQWWDIPAVLGEKTGLGMAYGVAGHYGNGILLAILYSGISGSLWGPSWLRLLTFITGETIALVWLFMLPLLGAGVAGINMDPMMPVISLMRHIVYGVPVFLVLHLDEYRGYTR
jgi:hypothetical protein